MNYYGFDPVDPLHPRQRVHTGFRLGAVGGLLMWGVYLVLLLIFQGGNQGDFLAWIIQLFVYFLIGRAAAQKHYDAQMDEIDALRGVQGAGTGAALVTSILVWVFIILRGIVRDAIGFMVLVEPVGLFCLVMIDVLIALGLGSWAGKTVVRKYQISFD